MGVDFLDLQFRLERSFALKLPSGWLDAIADPVRRDVQAGPIHAMIRRSFADDGRPLPPSAWHRVKLCIAQAGGCSPWKVGEQTWLVKELGFA